MNSDNYPYCSSVKMSIDAYTSCLNHTLLTEAEEVMGILLGKSIENDNLSNSTTIFIYSTICLSRKCKEKDRVEFDEIQISQASEIAENMSRDSKVEVNVVGWYHSHPKITIPPSNVDLNTQFSQQYQGPFVGIIISCFSSDQNNVNKINLIAFQTKKDSKGYHVPHYIEIEFLTENEMNIPKNQIMITTASTYRNILKNLLIEEQDLFNKYKNIVEENDYLNHMILFSERQGLLTKFIQILSKPYLESLDIEIYNLNHYISYLKNMNESLKKKIDQFEKMKNNIDS